jgi:hypothetical protein
MIWLFLVILIGGAFAIAVVASDLHFGRSDRPDEDKRDPPPPESDE